jgi:hypothetical protein
VSTVKRPSELFAQGYSLLQQVDRLGPVPFGKAEALESDQAGLFEAPRPQAADKLLRTPNKLAAVISLPESEGGHRRHQDRVQLGPLMTDACRSLHGDRAHPALVLFQMHRFLSDENTSWPAVSSSAM